MNEVDICNDALAAIGSDPITSISDATTKARLCARFYPTSRDEVLRGYVWNCAKVPTTLVKETWTAPDGFRWSYRYLLPPDPYCLWLPKVLNEDLDYEVMGRRIYTDEDTSIDIIYVGRVEPELFDPLMCSAISARLAHRLAYPLTRVTALPLEMWKLYLIKVQEARTMDAMEGSLDAPEATALTEVR